jgi:very-short-patch-repair endonuclease
MNRQARALRRQMTEAEKVMWSKLRDRRLDGVKFKRQKPIAGYIVDFVALDLKLIVEIDGGQHAERVEEDAVRTKVLEESGYHAVRFWNHDVLRNIEGVLESLVQELNLSRWSPSPQPSPRWGEGADRVLPQNRGTKKGRAVARPSKPALGINLARRRSLDQILQRRKGIETPHQPAFARPPSLVELGSRPLGWAGLPSRSLRSKRRLEARPGLEPG